MNSNTKSENTKNDKSFNIYLSHFQKELLKIESEKRGLTISSFLRSAALEKINRDGYAEMKAKNNHALTGKKNPKVVLK